MRSALERLREPVGEDEVRRAEARAASGEATPGPPGPGVRRVVAEESHACEELSGAENLRRKFEQSGVDHKKPHELLYGPAITRIEKASGRWWAHNDEYSIPVAYCPFCGAKLSTAG